MLDRSRPDRRSPGDLKPGTDDSSNHHYWLMRRDLSQRLPPPPRLESVRRVDLTHENAATVHRLLVLGSELGGGHVPDFETWWHGFDSDPEFDPALCFVLKDAEDVVAVAQCWTSAFIRYLVVHPRMQRQGIGLMLLNQAFQAFAKRREGHIDLNVMESNLCARRLYERAGMRYVQRYELEPR